MTFKEQADIMSFLRDFESATEYYCQVKDACHLYPDGNMRREMHTALNRRWEAYNKLIRAIGIEDIAGFYKRDCNGNLF